MRERRARAALSLVLALCCAGEVVAQTAPTAAEKDTARELARKGDVFFAQGDFENALALYSAAYRLVRVPTIGIQVAKTLAERGMLVEAKASADEVIRLPVQAGEPLVFGKARAAAGDLSLSLTQRIPALRLAVSPERVPVRVTVDEVELAYAGKDAPLELNPGTRRVYVTSSGYQGVEREVQLEEGQERTLEIKLVPLDSAAAAVPPPSTATAPKPNIAVASRAPAAAARATPKTVNAADRPEPASTPAGANTRPSPHRFGVGLKLFLGGEYSYYAESPITVGLFGAYDYLFGRNFSLGAELSLSRWSYTDSYYAEEVSGDLTALLIKPKLRLVPGKSHSSFELYLALGVGINVVNFEGYDQSGGSVSAGLGGSLWFKPKLGISLEAGMIAHAYDVSFDPETDGLLLWGATAGLEIAP